MFPIVVPAVVIFSFLLFHRFIGPLFGSTTKYQIYQLAMKTLLGVLGPSARHLHSAPASCWGYRCEGRGAKRCGTSQIHYISLGRVEGCSYFMSQIPQVFIPILAVWLGCPCSSGGELSSFSFSLGLSHTTQKNTG